MSQGASGWMRLALPLVLAACSHTRTLTLHLEPDARSNQGRPVYLLVRNTTPRAFIEQPYTAVASLVASPDETVRRAIVVFPGRRDRVELPVRDGERFGIFVLFTQPGAAWRHLFGANPPASARVVVGEREIAIDPP